MNQNNVLSELPCREQSLCEIIELQRAGNLTGLYIKEEKKRVFDQMNSVESSICPEASGWCIVWTCCPSRNPPCLCRTKPVAQFSNTVHEIRWLATVLDNPDKVNHKKGHIKRRLLCQTPDKSLTVYFNIRLTFSKINANKLFGMNSWCNSTWRPLFLHPVWTYADASSLRSGKKVLTRSQGLNVSLMGQH